MVVIAGLGIDAFVHVHVASAFAHNKTSVLSETALFRIDAALAVIAALALLLRPRRYTAAFAFLVAAGGAVAVVLYRYVDVGKLGPLPNMYDPFWAPFEKNLSAVAEALAAIAALVLFVSEGHAVRTPGGTPVRVR